MSLLTRSFSALLIIASSLLLPPATRTRASHIAAGANVNERCFASTDERRRIPLLGGTAGSLLTGDALLSMPEIDIEIPLAELYEGLDLTEPTDGASA